MQRIDEPGKEGHVRGRPEMEITHGVRDAGTGVGHTVV